MLLARLDKQLELLTFSFIGTSEQPSSQVPAGEEPPSDDGSDSVASSDSYSDFESSISGPSDDEDATDQDDGSQPERGVSDVAHTVSQLYRTSAIAEQTQVRLSKANAQGLTSRGVFQVSPAIQHKWVFSQRRIVCPCLYKGSIFEACACVYVCSTSEYNVLTLSPIATRTSDGRVCTSCGGTVVRAPPENNISHDPALSLAATFFQLSEHKQDTTRSAATIARPAPYHQE